MTAPGHACMRGAVDYMATGAASLKFGQAHCVAATALEAWPERLASTAPHHRCSLPASAASMCGQTLQVRIRKAWHQ